MGLENRSYVLVRLKLFFHQASAKAYSLFYYVIQENNRSRDSVVGITTDYRLVHRGVGV
jgi:hypothetical protein